MEPRKTAVHKNRLLAVYHTVLHIVPLGCAVALLALNWSSFFIGQRFENTSSLQFVAKLHELLMQVSIAEVVLTIVRTQAINDYLPLGALSVAMQANQIGYIWSLDLMSVFTSQAILGWRKLLFLVLVPILVIMTGLVGPSSAALMIPRPGTGHTIGVADIHLNASRGNLFPSRVDRNNGMSM